VRRIKLFRIKRPGGEKTVFHPLPGASASGMSCSHSCPNTPHVLQQSCTTAGFRAFLDSSKISPSAGGQCISINMFTTLLSFHIWLSNSVAFPFSLV
jgi:hypothetical protein